MCSGKESILSGKTINDSPELTFTAGFPPAVFFFMRTGSVLLRKNLTCSEEFRQKIYALVRMIPRGRVATYGQLAFLAGYPRHARMVGRALKEVPQALKLPCHRVVNASGRCVPGWKEQPERLRRERVEFLPGGNVDLNLCLWNSFDDPRMRRP